MRIPPFTPPTLSRSNTLVYGAGAGLTTGGIYPSQASPIEQFPLGQIRRDIERNARFVGCLSVCSKKFAGNSDAIFACTRNCQDGVMIEVQPVGVHPLPFHF
jgi:hypothetical protein